MPWKLAAILVALAALVLGVLAAPQAASGTTTASLADGTQPPPGYTISNPPLPPLTIGGGQTRVLQGVHEQAAYIVEAPPQWNGQLVMWAHGYRGPSSVLTVDPPEFGLRQRFLDQGFAWAASSYTANGYDVRAGVLSTRALARHTATLLSRTPTRTYLTGVSMGGHVTARSLEQYPGVYAGAMPMCGAIGDHQLFDFFLDYNLVAQDLADTPAYPIPADYLTRVVPQIQTTLGLAGLRPGGPDTLTERGRQLRAITVERSGGQRPAADQAFAVWKDVLFGLATPGTGGRLADNPDRLAQNVLTRYSPEAPVPVNRTVQRVVPADLGARFDPRLTEIPIVFSRPRVPVLSLHGIGDLFVPFSMEQQYATEAARWGQSRFVVSRAIRSAGHCEFSPAEAGRGWDDLVGWVSSGAAARPAGDPVTNRSAVAAPTFGCRFTDKAVYGTGSRPLYAPCP